MKELDEERKHLERTLADLTHGRVGRRRPGRPRGSTTRRRRGRRGGTRADQALKIVSENPGITASEIAKRMRIKPNYVYRVMGELQKDKRVRKRGRGYRGEASSRDLRGRSRQNTVRCASTSHGL